MAQPQMQPSSLGEQIVEEKGKVSSRRVLPSDGPNPKVETSFQASGTILGVEHTNMGTYQSVLRPNGTLFGEGQGVVITKDGEVLTWTGSGVGRLTGNGAAARYRGAIYYSTTSQKLARLNAVAGIFEFDTDENGNTHSNIWEWK